MNSRQYEEYVADVVRSLSISKKAKVYMNRKYAGVRQPGSYEIDVACEVWIDKALFFLIIVECKNWKNPVDRPQIQKLIQTRDAISAHKAAFASPVGYTKEAIEVAKANGVALWVVAKGTFDELAGGGYAAVSVASIISSNLRWFVYDLLEYAGEFYKNLIPSHYLRYFEDRYTFLSQSEVSNRISDAKTNLARLSWFDGRIDFSANSELYFSANNRHDPIMATLISHTLRNLYLDTSVTSKVAARIIEYRSILIESGMKPKLAQKFMNGVIKSITFSDDASAFARCVSFALPIDRKCNHRKVELLAPIDWVKENGWRIHIAPSFPSSTSEIRLRDNIVWANVIWLLNSVGLLEENPNWLRT